MTSTENAPLATLLARAGGPPGPDATLTGLRDHVDARARGLVARRASERPRSEIRWTCRASFGAEGERSARPNERVKVDDHELPPAPPGEGPQPGWSVPEQVRPRSRLPDAARHIVEPERGGRSLRRWAERRPSCRCP